jgi:ribosomal protein L32
MDASSEISTPNASFEIHLWHRRYGHLHYARLYHLSQKDKVCGLPPFKLAHEICSNCLAGQHREHFPKASTHHSTQVLNLIHTNLVGTLKTWVYFLKQKGEAYQKFQEFKTRVEKETGKQILNLRSDRGGEFLSQEFITYCRNAGIL